MQQLTAKQEARLHNKTKKMAAYAEILELNDKDRRRKKHCSYDDETKTLTKSGTKSSANEPNCKRQKTDLSMDVSSSRRKTDDETKEVASETVNDEKKSIAISQALYEDLKKNLIHRKRELKHSPKLQLKLFGENATLKIPSHQRTPIFLTDIENLIVAPILGVSKINTPRRWCQLEKIHNITHTIVLVIDGLSLCHFEGYQKKFEKTCEIFKNHLEVIMPPYKDGHVIEKLLTIPIVNNKKNELIKKYASSVADTNDTGVKTNGKLKLEQQQQQQLKPSINSHKTDTFPRTKLLLSALQMVDGGYPLPLRGELSNRYKDFVYTKDCYAEVTAGSPMFGLDCEMCRTSIGVNELTRICIINENCERIYDTLVRPENKIIDYLTQYSGITHAMMLNVTKTLREVQNDIRTLLPADAILVGQSLNSDLMSMRMMHPYIIDTSVIYNVSGDRQRKSKLQTLSLKFLNEAIQTNPLGHDPYEDCVASVKLTNLKLSKGIDFGDEVMLRQKYAIEKQTKMSNVVDGDANVGVVGDNKKPEDAATIIVPQKNYNNNNRFNDISKKDQSTVIISSSEVGVDYQKILLNERCPSGGDGDNSAETRRKIMCLELDNNKSVISKTKEISMEHALTLSHIKFVAKYLELRKIEKTISTIDRWIHDLWNTLAINGMLVIVLSALPETQSGVALVNIKNPLPS